MPASLDLDRYLAALGSAAERLRRCAADAGWDAPVPTCGGWDVGGLVAHQSMVHRWATAVLRGDDPDGVPSAETMRAEQPDLDAWFAEGAAALIDTLHSAPADLQVMTFLKDPPAPREFWARRQAHETTIHAVDALSAALGRVPTAAEVGLDTALAEDGIDELLRGFFTRGRCKLHDGTRRTLLVAPTDSPRRWAVTIDERLTVADGDATTVDGVAPDTVLSGTAAALHLALWNRGDEVDGDVALLERWRADQRVSWS